jgi:hypothetical protein
MGALMKVIDLCGPFCASSEDGKKIYDSIFDKLKNTEITTLDFTGVKITSTSFFNVALGELYRDFSPDFLNYHLKIINLPPGGKSAITHSLSASKINFRLEGSPV